MNRLLLGFFFLLFFSTLTFAQSVPSPQGFVLDTSGTLSALEEQALEARVGSIEETLGVEIAVFLFPSLEGGDMFEFTQRVFDEWKIGKKGADNGVLITIATQDREWRIHTGYGVEGDIPDGLAYQIGTQRMVPFLAEGDYVGGINAAIDEMENVLKGSPTVSEYQNSEADFFTEPFELFGLGWGMALVAAGLFILLMIRMGVALLPKEKGAELFATHAFTVLFSSVWGLAFVGFGVGVLLNGFYGFTALSAGYLFMILFGKFPFLSASGLSSGSHWGSGGLGGGSWGGGSGGFGRSGGGSFGGGMRGGGGAGGRF